MLPFRRIVDQRLANLFMIWLVGCIVVTQLGIARIANAAHVGGLIFGVLTAMVFVRRERLWLFAPLLAAVVVLSFVPLFWCPLSPQWRALHAARQTEHATANR
jgi:GlpG protein